MQELSIKNINYITEEVSKSGITYSHLLYDLIDHVCCDVENEMKKGLPFEKAYETVKLKIGIGGLQRIQDNTLYLIDKNYRTMKKTMRFFGVLSPILLAIGTLFRIEHWPLAGFILVFGFFFLSCFFLPSAIYVSYKEISNKTRKWSYIVGFLGTFFLSVSFLFKVQHWPFASILLMAGILLTCFVFLPSLLIHKFKETASDAPKYVYILAYLGFIFILLGFTFKPQHWPGASFLLFGGCILFIFVALPIYVYTKYKESASIENSFIYIIIVIALFIIPISLLSLNLSRRVLASTEQTEDVIKKDIQYLLERNDHLIKQMPKDSLALQIGNETDKLFNDIQNAKTDLINIAQGENGQTTLNEKHQIETRKLNKLTNSVTEQFELLETGEIKNIAESYNRYRALVSKTNKNADFKEIIQEILPGKFGEQIFDMHTNEAIMLNRLSFIQLSILKAENTAFKSMIKSKASNL